MNDRQHLQALSLEAEAERFAAEEGITALQAYRNLRDRQFLAGQVRRQNRDN